VSIDVVIQADELDGEPRGPRRFEGAPLDAPSDGAPPTPTIPHHDRDSRPDENPDYDQYLPLRGAAPMKPPCLPAVTVRDRECSTASPNTSPSPPRSFTFSSSLVFGPAAVA
jgi:hypothetical protein